MKITKNRIVLLVVVLLLSAASVYYFGFRRDDPANKPTDSTSQNSGEILNLNPPTESEKMSDDDKKSDQITQTENGQASLKSAKPVITSAGQFDNVQYGSAIEIRTLISGVYESGGKCTATLTNGTNSISKTVDAIQDVSTTICDVVTIPRDEFVTAGTWSLVVKYSSTKYSGESDITTLEVK